MIIENNMFMVKTIGVRGPTLARLAMVLVLCFKPAVNRQPGFRRGLVEQVTLFEITLIFISHY